MVSTPFVFVRGDMNKPDGTNADYESMTLFAMMIQVVETVLDLSRKFFPARRRIPLVEAPWESAIKAGQYYKGGACDVKMSKVVNTLQELLRPSALIT